MVKALDLAGKRFGRLLVLGRAENNRFGQSYWRTKCDCGTQRIVAGSHLSTGHTRSCGCLVSDITRVRSTKHGHASRAKRTRAYTAWKEMKRRLRRDKHYVGAELHPEWETSYDAFYAHVGDCPDGYELDRIDNDKGYIPGNVRWVTETMQSRNRGYCKLSMEKAEAIRADPRSARLVARDYGVAKSQILKVRRGEAWA